MDEALRVKVPATKLEVNDRFTPSLAWLSFSIIGLEKAGLNL
jgi:hypothetical protein